MNFFRSQFLNIQLYGFVIKQYPSKHWRLNTSPHEHNLFVYLCVYICAQCFAFHIIFINSLDVTKITFFISIIIIIIYTSTPHTPSFILFFYIIIILLFTKCIIYTSNKSPLSTPSTLKDHHLYFSKNNFLFISPCPLSISLTPLSLSLCSNFVFFIIQHNLCLKCWFSKQKLNFFKFFLCYRVIFKLNK